jgi:hypothetical protein
METGLNKSDVLTSLKQKGEELLKEKATDKINELKNKENK